MELQFKEKVSQELNKWLQESPENRSLTRLSDENGVSKTYVSAIKNGVYQIEQRSGKPTVIADEFFYRIAEAIGLMTRSLTGLHWETSNFRLINKVCKAAQHKRLRMLVEGRTGTGKTYSLEHYAIKGDKVLYIKVTRSMTERNLLEAILKKLGIRDHIRGNREKLNVIRHTLVGTPGFLLILDEIEYARKTLYHVFKEIADFLEGKCGFILSGYGVIKIIRTNADKDRMGFPQLKRRFFPNRTLLPERIENTEKRSICEQSGITNESAVRVICQYCEDFDMLSQVVSDIDSWQKANNRKITGEIVMDRFRESFDL